MSCPWAAIGLPSISLNNLKTSLRFPCLGLNAMIDSIMELLYLQSFYAVVGYGEANLYSNGDSFGHHINAIIQSFN